MSVFQTEDEGPIPSSRIMHKYCYFNGRRAKLAAPLFRLNDLGLLRGYAVFDFIRVTNRRPLFWREHLTRWRRSIRRLGLQLKASDKEITRAAEDLIKQNKIKEGSLRLILTGGETVDGLTPGRPNWGILAEGSYYLPEKIFTRGGKLITCNYRRIFPEAKTTNYLQAVAKLPTRRQHGAMEILYLDRGRILEASTSNFFLVFKQKIVTPKTDILLGVTRTAVINLARQIGLQVVEREVKFSEIASATEAFLTATNKDVAPIIQIDNKKIGSGHVGPITKLLLDRYRQLVKEENS